MGRGLSLGGRLDRYVGLLFVTSYVTGLFVLVGLFMIVDMSANLSTYFGTWKNGTSVPLALTLRYFLLSIPFVFLQVAPFVTLVAGLFTATRMIKHNEVTAALAAGVRSHRLLAPVFLSAIVCGVGMFVLRETASATLARQKDAIGYVLNNQKYDEVYTDLWIRGVDGDVVHLAEFRPATASRPVAELRGLVATQLTASRWLKTEATRGVYEERGGKLAWWLEDGVCREVQGSQSAHAIDHLQDVDFTPALALAFHRARTNPVELSDHEARELGRRDPDNVVYKTLMQHHVTFSIANLVLLLVGLPMVMQRSRGRPIERLALGCVLCVFYFACDFVMMNLGLQGGISPYFAAWLPILLFGSLGLVLFESMES